MSGDDAQQLANCICIRRSLAALGCPESRIAGATSVDELHELTMHYSADHGASDCDLFEWSNSDVIAPQGLCVDSGCSQLRVSSAGASAAGMRRSRSVTPEVAEPNGSGSPSLVESLGAHLQLTGDHVNRNMQPLRAAREGASCSWRRPREFLCVLHGDTHTPPSLREAAGEHDDLPSVALERDGLPSARDIASVAAGTARLVLKSVGSIAIVPTGLPPSAANQEVVTTSGPSEVAAARGLVSLHAGELSTRNSGASQHSEPSWF
jgi:hypothetical protein